MLEVLRVWLRCLKDEEGQGMVEYALIIALVAIALIAVVGGLTGGLSHVFSDITSTLNSAGNP
jgi:pilus assembly protein Flp/PilA